MPKSKAQFERIKKIDERLNKLHRTKKRVLVSWLGVNEKTIRRDIEYMREKYKAPIELDINGYFYSENFSIPWDLVLSGNDIRELQLAGETLNQFKGLDAFKNIQGLIEKIVKSVKFKINSESKNHIFFESVPAYEGTSQIDFFLDAIKKQKIVEFEYQSFKSNKIFLHKFCPYFLKEHTNRWYVIGELWLADKKVISPYALERIIVNEKRKMTEQPFKVREGFSPTEHFNKTYGIAVIEENKVVNAILEFSKIQAKYFESKPFIGYQDISEEQDCTKVKIEIRPNKELIRKLASMGNGVKIIEPKELRDDVIRYLETALIQYGNK